LHAGCLHAGRLAANQSLDLMFGALICSLRADPPRCACCKNYPSHCLGTMAFESVDNVLKVPRVVPGAMRGWIARCASCVGSRCARQTPEVEPRAKFFRIATKMASFWAVVLLFLLRPLREYVYMKCCGLQKASAVQIALFWWSAARRNCYREIPSRTACP
jgi:hypothetical protein